MSERVCLYGAERDQLGILAEPAVPDADRPAVLFWNAGFLHRVGPYRSFTDLARRLTDSGYVTFRFDLSGLGDSRPHRDSRSNEERALGDIRATMDLVGERTGHTRFVLVGLCSGADQAHPAALADERVAGFVMLDGYMYPTARWLWRHLVYHYGRRVVSVAKWKGKLARLFAGGPAEAEETFVRTFPPREKVRAELTTLLDRGLEALFVYTGGVPYYNYAGQFRDAFGAGIADRDNVSVEFYAAANHTYTLLGDRARLHDRIRAWLDARFAAVPAETAAHEV